MSHSFELNVARSQCSLFTERDLQIDEATIVRTAIELSLDELSTDLAINRFVQDSSS